MLITAEKAIDILSLYMNFFQQLLMGGGHRIGVSFDDLVVLQKKFSYLWRVLFHVLVNPQ